MVEQKLPKLKTRVRFPSPAPETEMRFLPLLLLLFCTLADAAILKVGPGEKYPVPSAAAKEARDNDIVEIEPGTYRGDVAVWNANGLVIRGTGTRPVLDADGKSAEGKAIWVIKGNFTTVENLAFENAAVRDRNGAGIRLEGRDLMVSNCLFRNNQNGILTGENPESSVYILDSEFDHNGAGDGYSHNLYVGGVKKLVVRRCYLHGAVVGHDLKSRAYESVVTDNRIADDGGESSYEADFPNGGKVLLAFNVIQQGERAQNYTMVAYGEEGMRPSGNSFTAKGNTFLNQHELGGVFIRLAKGNIETNLIGNVFYGNGLLPDIPGIREHNDFTMTPPGNANWRPNSRQN